MPSLKYIIVIFCLICFTSSTGFSQTIVFSPNYSGADNTTFTSFSANGTPISISGTQNTQVFVATNSGEIKITNTANLSAPNGYSSAQWNGNASLAFSGQVSDVNNALNSMEYRGNGGNITIHALPQSGAFDETNQKYYVLEQTPMTWSNANSFANSYSIRGQTGHLATITSVIENTFLTNNLPLVSEAWFGGSDAAVEDEWRWITGPENGTLFFRGRKGNHQPVPGVYHNFHWSQPGWPPEPADYVIFTVLGDWADEIETKLYHSIIELNASPISFTIGSTQIENKISNVEIQNFLLSNAIKNSSEQVKSAEFVMREKMVFHGEMMRSSAQDKPARFLDYDLNIDANDTSFIGEGHYYQTNVLDSQYRRRVLIDSKRVHSKNENETIILSGLYLLDMGISEKTSTQYRIGLKQSVTNQEASSLNSKAEARSYRLGGSLSHSFTDEVFGGVFGDLIYTETNSRLETSDTKVKGYTKVFSTTGGAQLTGQYKVVNKQWIKPSFAFSYNKDHLMKENFTSFSGSTATSIEPSISMPTIYRITIEPEFLYEETVISKNIAEYISINPSYACETLKTSITNSECNFGLYTQIGQRNKTSSIENKLYFSYENLNGGPRHEYGLQIKFDL